MGTRAHVFLCTHTHTHTQMVAIHKLATTLVLLDGVVPVPPWAWI